VLTTRRTDDLDACVAVLAAVHEVDGYPARWPDEPGRWLTPRDLLDAWVARRADEVVGHVCLCRAEAGAAVVIWSAATGLPAERLGVISRLFVAPAARRQGLGERLLVTACDEARRLGRHPVLEVMRHDRAAAALYEALGWRRAGPLDTELRWYVARGGQ
jgi:GNAT superfamily N-acetyltransferase